MERSLIILKPDALQRGIVGDIMSRFERVGLKIVAAKMLQPDTNHYHHHYETISKMISRRGQQAFDVTLEMMQQGPVLAYVLEGVGAIEVIRKIVGATEPKSAAVGTIRGDYAHVSFAHADKEETGIPNLIHASGDAAEAVEEIKHWFADTEIYDYDPLHAKYTQPKKSKNK